MSGFPSQWICDSWRVGLRRADHADQDEGRRLGNGVGGVPASCSRRGDKGRNDRKFLEALHYFTVHNITWRALPEFRQLEFGVEAVLALEPGRRVRGLLRGPRSHEPDRASGADVRLHHRAGACLGGRRKRGQTVRRSAARAAASRPRSTSRPTRWWPLAFHLTEGQASDSPQFEILLDLGPDITPRAAVGDKGYDGKANRRRPASAASAR